MVKKHPLKNSLYRRICWDDLCQKSLIKLIERARDEDILGEGLSKKPHYSGDLTTEFLRQSKGAAHFVAREDLIFCGMELIPLILNSYGESFSFKPFVEDGDCVPAGGVLCELFGNATLLLRAERVMLNFVQHLSGIATKTKAFVDALGGSHTKLLDTRKTTPGYRVLEKYAVACGGAWNHRLGLFDRVMLKDNHWASEGMSGETLATSVQQIREHYPEIPVEIEVDHLGQIQAVLDAQADVVLLDNFSIKEIQHAIKEIDGRLLTEASGNVSLENLPTLGQLGLDFISCGAITHQSRWVDIGMDWVE